MVEVIPCSLPDTQSQKEFDWNEENDINVPKVWGWLYPTRLHLKPLDLVNSTFTLGRSIDCDIVLNGQNITPNILKIVSKRHFKIYREDVDQSTIMYLEDCSYNGTFINGQRVGKGKKVILQNGDEISIGHPSVRVYVFKCICDSVHLPKEISSKYVVTRLLGTGACGEVKLVWNKKTCEKYAMKKIVKNKFMTILKKPQANDPARIMNEVKILKSLNHPCVIHMEDIVDTEDAVYIILELMEGGELFDRIVSFNLGIPEPDAKIIFYQIILAVYYLHQQGITHRDLKPENILLSENRPDTIVKVSDFGLSKFVNEETVLTTVCGTPMYVAPEILLTKGRGSYTKQIDVWSLGVILYVTLSGHLPFSQDDPKLTLAEQITKGIYTFPYSCFKNVSNTAIDLIKKILVVDPTKRLTVEEILKHPWFNDEILLSKVSRLIGSEHIVCDFGFNLDEEQVFEPNSKRLRICN
ncbi:ovarian-specific serine/threonine-protein kinase Lok [Chrysoperla carnea]|uniref:ovarian-specific serine/threonine-protein kinase Lok n=1 Tax=Chrysoperla carnea TaxID=189513 RepID=UPI001D099D04|nr:ovarian-specific serine/threonine-protein kinase Lok [Chrysoperla carnea]